MTVYEFSDLAPGVQGMFAPLSNDITALLMAAITKFASFGAPAA